jgi:hypothetical protein
VPHFLARSLHPARDHVGSVLPALVEAILERLQRRRQDEDQHRARDQLADLARPLPVDLEQHVVAGLHFLASHVADVAYQLPWTNACSRNSPLSFSAMNVASSTK